MRSGEGRGVVWPPEGVEPAAPAPRRRGTGLQPWRTPSGVPVLRVVHPPAPPQPPLGARLIAALGNARDGLVALGEAAELAAAAVPQLAEGDPS